MQKTKRKHVTAGVAALAAICLVMIMVSPVSAGSLTPPGAPASTMKTLDQVEPRTPITAAGQTISSSGSYYLTGNLTVSSGNGITVDADDVTIDLMGFSLIGGGGSYGIYGTGCRNIVIMNGTIKSFSFSGIKFESSHCSRVIGVSSLSNAGSGISLGTGNYGWNMVVQGCQIRNNSATGVEVGRNSIVADNTVYGNAGYGIYAQGISPNDSSGCRISGNVVYSNGGDTLCGIYVVGFGNIIERNTVRANGGNGIYVDGSGSVLRGNACYENDKNGFELLRYGHTVVGNTANNNDHNGFKFSSSGHSFYDQNTGYWNNRSGGGYFDLSGCNSNCTAGNNYFQTHD